MGFNEKWKQVSWGLMECYTGMGFKPNAVQQPIVTEFENGCRLLQICGGERSGKSLLASALLLLALEPDVHGEKRKKRRYWIVGPDYRQCRPEFQYVRDALSRGGFIDKESMPLSDTQPWSLTTKWGVTLETRSAGEVMKLASFTVDGVILAEAAQQTEESLRKMLGRIAESRGFIVMVGTLEDGLPWYESYLRRWAAANPEGGRSFSLPTWSNTDVFPKGKDDPEMIRLIAALPADYVANRFGAVPVRRSNLVVPEFEFNSHVRHLPVRLDLPVELAVDPGKNAYVCLFMQHEGAFTYVLDCVYQRSTIAQRFIPDVMRNPLWQYVVPNAPNTHVIDIAGNQEPGSESQVKIWREIAGVNFSYRYYKERDTIATLRHRLHVDPITGTPLVLFADTMKTGIAPDGTATEMLSEFDLWRWPKHSMQGREADAPIDANNHALKALGYKLQNRYGHFREEKKRGEWGIKQKSWNPLSSFG